jgi:glucokinase
MPHVLAIDLGGTKCSAAVVDQSGRIVSRRNVAVDISSTSAPVLQIVDLANKLAAEKKPKQAYVAAAIAVPGLVRRTGTVWAPNLPGWGRMPLARRLQRAIGIPVIVESDRNAAVLGETWRGAARGKSDAIVLMIGTGIGAGILSEGRLLRGAHELSGCAGWLTITRSELPNIAGAGELESLASGPAIARAARQRSRQEESSLSQLEVSRITAHEVATAARAGDGLALDVFANAGRFLGYGISNMVSILDPEVVILGGGLSAVADLYLESLRNAMMERAQPVSAKQVRVVVSRLGGKANLLGCARIAWHHSKRRD